METYFQLIVNSLCSGFLLGLVASGFSYIFYVTKVFHLAHASLYALSGLTTWQLYQLTNSFAIAVTTSILICCGLIYFIERTIYLPISKSNADQSVSLISSMGIYIVIVNILALIFGNENRVYSAWEHPAISFGEISITGAQQTQLGISLVVFLLSHFLLKWKNINLTLKALAESEIKSSLLGINPNRSRLFALVFGTILICLASWANSLETGIEPYSGMNMVLTAAVVSILVTRLNLSIIVLGSILLSFLQSAIEWNLNAQWKNGLTFTLLLTVVLFKTEGLISYNIRRDNK